MRQLDARLSYFRQLAFILGAVSLGDGHELRVGRRRNRLDSRRGDALENRGEIRRLILG